MQDISHDKSVKENVHLPDTIKKDKLCQISL